MKKQTVEIMVYEPGDVIDIDQVVFREQNGSENSSAKSQKKIARLTSNNRMMIISMEEGRLGILYRGIMNNGKLMTLKNNELGSEKYIGHIDLALLMNDSAIKQSKE